MRAQPGRGPPGRRRVRATGRRRRPRRRGHDPSRSSRLATRAQHGRIQPAAAQTAGWPRPRGGPARAGRPPGRRTCSMPRRSPPPAPPPGRQQRFDSSKPTASAPRRAVPAVRRLGPVASRATTASPRCAALVGRRGRARDEERVPAGRACTSAARSGSPASWPPPPGRAAAGAAGALRPARRAGSHGWPGSRSPGRSVITSRPAGRRFAGPGAAAVDGGVVGPVHVLHREHVTAVGPARRRPRRTPARATGRIAAASGPRSRRSRRAAARAGAVRRSSQPPTMVRTLRSSAARNARRAGLADAGLPRPAPRRRARPGRGDPSSSASTSAPAPGPRSSSRTGGHPLAELTEAVCSKPRVVRKSVTTPVGVALRHHGVDVVDVRAVPRAPVGQDEAPIPDARRPA